MNFQHTWQAVLDGTKTQTRRLARPGDTWTQAMGFIMVGRGAGGWIESAPRHDTPFESACTVYRRERPLYRVGHTYAVQPGRGKPAIARICITDIRREDVRRISEADAWAEGFSITPKYEFLQVWTRMHDKGIGEWLFSTEYDPVLPDHCPLFLLSRPAERYTAWVLTFEVVK